MVDWNDRKYYEVWRSAWAEIQNQFLQSNGRSERVDLRSYERQGVDQVPMIHTGSSVAVLEKKGVVTNIGNLNRDIRQHNRILARIRSVISTLKNWITGLSEKRKLILEMLQERQEPTLVELLSDYLEIRFQERSGWSSIGQLRGAVADHQKAEEAIDYLKAHKIRTVNDLKRIIDDKSCRASEIRDEIRENTSELKEHSRILACYETYRKLAPVQTEYLKKNFRVIKERFYAAHMSEIDEYRKVNRYLVNHGAEKKDSTLVVDVPQHEKRRDFLEKYIKGVRTGLSVLQEDLETLNNVRYYVSKVQPEAEEVAKIVKEDPERRTSIRTRLKENQKRILAEEQTRQKSKKDRGRNCNEN